jgi:tetratricopeptide (TPR) repeat protein
VEGAVKVLSYATVFIFNRIVISEIWGFMQMKSKTVEYRKLSYRIYKLYRKGNTIEVEKELRRALKKAAHDEPYRYFFTGLFAGYIKKDAKKQESFFRKAVELKPDDNFLLRDLGVLLVQQGKEEEAIECFKNVVAKKAYYFDTLKELGVLLSRQGKEKEAIKCFDKILASKDDYHALLCRGMAYSKIGEAEDAIADFKNVQDVHPEYYKDALFYKYWATSDVMSGDYDDAFERIKLAYRLNPDDKEIFSGLQMICRCLNKDINTVIRDVKGKAAVQFEPSTYDIMGLVMKVIREFGPQMNKYTVQKKAVEKELNEFLNSSSNLRQDTSFFLLLKKWNSGTPAIPSGTEDRSVGGGYFIWHRGKGTVIDPGFNFIKNFSAAGGKIIDIDNIIITHAHNDHTNDFESIMTLLYEFNDVNNADKRVNVYLNTGAFIKFSGLLNLRECNYIDRIFSVTHGNTYDLGKGLILNVVPAYHDELISTKYSVGLHFTFDFDSDGKRTLLFTSDTGLYPPKKDYQTGKSVADMDKKEIHKLYGDFAKGVDLLVPHIGSIKEYEVASLMPPNFEEIFYLNHLGIHGTARLITSINPELAVVSEFGEELKHFRKELIRLLEEVVEEYMNKAIPKILNIPKILPGDIPFIYDIERKEIYCIRCRKMQLFKRITYDEYDERFYYYCNDSEKLGAEQLKGLCNCFETDRKSGNMPSPTYLGKKGVSANVVPPIDEGII